jgi:hypothetical protein
VGEWLRRAAPLLLLAAGIVAIAVLRGPSASRGAPLDPDSTGRPGTKALIATLEGLGASVDVTGARAGTRGRPPVDTLLVLRDDFDERTRDELRGFAAEGGTLVVADPSSSLTPDPVGTTAVGILQTTLSADCGLPALEGVERIAAPGAAVYEVPEGETGCFRRNEGAWMVVEPTAKGRVVALGGPSALVNAQLGRADNAVLAASLLTPERASSLGFVRPPSPESAAADGEGSGTAAGGGSSGLVSLIDPRIIAAAVQLAVAFLVVIAWRARRLGKPVTEPQPVSLPGSRLTAARGELMGRARSRGQAADLLRADLRRTLSSRLGVPISASPEQMADTVAARTELDRDDVVAVLAGIGPADEGELVTLADEVERIREAATGHPTRVGSASTSRSR